MEIQRQSQVLRSHLLKMTMLSHRAVDYSIKAYEFGDPEFGRLARNSEHEWHKVQCLIGGRGRILMAAGTPIDSDSLIARSTLRIYGALRVTYAAATEIAHNSMLIAECGLPITCREIGLMGRFVNGLVRLYTVALFKMEIRHAQTILQNDQGRQWFDLALSLTHRRLSHQTGAQARNELAIAQSLGQIAHQAYEIAEAFTSCLDGGDCLDVLRDRAA